MPTIIATPPGSAENGPRPAMRRADAELDRRIKNARTPLPPRKPVGFPSRFGFDLFSDRCTCVPDSVIGRQLPA